jgi:hypothetical protein
VNNAQGFVADCMDCHLPAIQLLLCQDSPWNQRRYPSFHPGRVRPPKRS